MNYHADLIEAHKQRLQRFAAAVAPTHIQKSRPYRPNIERAKFALEKDYIPPFLPARRPGDPVASIVKRAITEKTAAEKHRSATTRRTVGYDPKWSQIAAEVAKATGISIEEMCGSCRTRRIVPARAWLAYRLRTETAMSTGAIGKLMNRDHTTVLFLVGKHEKTPGSGGTSMSLPKDTQIGLRHVSDALGSATHDYAQQNSQKMDLRTHPGKGWTAFELGLPRLQRHAAETGLGTEGVKYVECMAREQFTKAIPMLESPIERTMFGALITGHWSGFQTIPARVHDSRRDTHELLPVGDLVVVPQLALFKYRLDFGLVIEREDMPQRQICALECDGAEFHAGENAARDRIRNGYLASWNIPTFRLKGSEIHEDAIRYADELIAEICRWKAS